MAIKTLTGGVFQDSGGNAIALGSISFQLSTPAVVSGTGQVVQDVVITYSLDSSGNIVLSTPTPSLWGNDQLTPTGTFYIVNIYSATGALVRGPENWVLQGSSPISLTAIIPASSAVSYPGAVLLTPTGNQTITTGSLTVSGGVIAPLTGNVTGDITSSGTSAFANETISGVVSSYNGVLTAGVGMASVVSVVDLLNQTAAKGTTTLLPVTLQTVYRISWWAKIITAGSVSSTLGALTITYQYTDNVSITATAAAQISAGTIATTSAANTTSTVLQGVPLIIYPKGSTNIQYAFAYAANAAASMVYDLHIRVEPI